MTTARPGLFALTVVNPATGAQRRSWVLAGGERLARLMALSDPTEVVAVEHAGPAGSAIAAFLFSRPAGIGAQRELYASLARCLAVDRSLLRALEMTLPALRSQGLRHAVSLVHQGLISGETLGEALRHLGGIVPAGHLVMMRAGERSGELSQVLVMLAESLEKQDQALRRLRRALVYPALLLMIGLAAVIAASVFLVPRVAELYAGFRAPLPAITQAMVALSGILRLHPALPLLAFLPPVLLLRNAGRLYREPRIQEIIHLVPGLHSLLFKAALARCLFTLSLLLRSHIPLDEALDLAARATAHVRLRTFLESLRRDLLRGLTPFAAANQHRHLLGREGFTFLGLLRLGEKNGDLQAVLGRLAAVYQDEVDGAVASVDKLVEPLTLVLVGGLICYVVLAIYYPIVTLNTLIIPHGAR